MLLPAHPATCDALAELLGRTEEWAPAGAAPRPPSLTDRHPDTAHAVAALLADR